MPKVKYTAPMETTYTDDRLGITEAMEDEDLEYSIIANFEAGASITEGVSGVKTIDTLYENTSEEDIERPRSGHYAPVQVNEYETPHRRY